MFQLMFCLIRLIKFPQKIENIFQKTFPKSVKRLMKIKIGVMSRINIKIEIQTQKKLFDI